MTESSSTPSTAASIARQAREVAPHQRLAAGQPHVVRRPSRPAARRGARSPRRSGPRRARATGRPSAGMQYWQRKLQRSVTDTRTSPMVRPCPSMSWLVARVQPTAVAPSRPGRPGAAVATPARSVASKSVPRDRARRRARSRRRRGSAAMPARTASSSPTAVERVEEARRRSPPASPRRRPGGRVVGARCRRRSPSARASPGRRAGRSRGSGRARMRRVGGAASSVSGGRARRRRCRSPRASCRRARAPSRTVGHDDVADVARVAEPQDTPSAISPARRSISGESAGDVDRQVRERAEPAEAEARLPLLARAAAASPRRIARTIATYSRISATGLSIVWPCQPSTTGRCETPSPRFRRPPREVVDRRRRLRHRAPACACRSARRRCRGGCARCAARRRSAR